MQTLFQKFSALRSHTGKTKRVFLVKARVPYVNRQDRATAVQSHAKGRVIVQPQILPKPKNRNHHKNGMRNYLLYHLQLQQIKRASIVTKPNAVGGYLKNILKKRNAPAD